MRAGFFGLTEERRRNCSHFAVVMSVLLPSGFCRPIWIATVFYFINFKVLEANLVPAMVEQCYMQPQLKDMAYTLPRSLDHFLYLVEKLQRSPSLDMLDASSLATVILKRFQVNGVVDVFHKDGTMTGVHVNMEEDVKQSIVHTFLPNVSVSYEEGLLAPEEQCVMHFMMSWKLNKTRPWWHRRTWEGEQIGVREEGCVLVDENRAGTVSLGPLLAGIAAAAAANRQFRIVDLLTEDERGRIPEQSQSLLSALVDNIYAVTLAAELGESSILHGYPSNSKVLVGPEGTWDNLDCPREYSYYLNSSSAATTAEIYGAIDGLILGNKLKELLLLEMPKPGLSQLLRMYYGRGVEADAVHGCDRGIQLGKLNGPILEQTRYFSYVYLVKGRFNFPFVAVSQATVDVMTAFNFKYQGFVCSELPYSTKCELKNDVFLVMDVHPSVAHDEFRDQRRFLLTVINSISRRYNATNFSVHTNGARFKDFLRLDRSFPSSLQRCEIANGLIDPSRPNMATTIKHLQVVIRAVKNEQLIAHVAGFPAKVVVFLYLQSSLPNRLDVLREMRSFTEEHPDVTLLAIGKNVDTLKILVKDEKYDVFTKRGEELEYHIPRLLKRICAAGTVVEYPECSRGDPSPARSLTEFVYPDTHHWFRIPSMYFNISQSLRISVKPDYGSVKVCSTRVPPEVIIGRGAHGHPQGGQLDCRDASSGSVTGPVAVFGPFEPCADWPLGNCPAFYWSVQGKGKGPSERCLSSSCESYNQIQVTISHEGARCLGPALSPSPMLALWFGCMLPIRLFHL